MDRREALSVVSMICGGVVIGAGGFLSGCGNNKPTPLSGVLDEQQQSLVEDAAETILPKSADSPGAKDVETGKFINSMVSDCYTETERQAFLNGLIKLDEISNLMYGNTFLILSLPEKNELILNLEEEAKEFNQSLRDGTPPHYYTMIKQLTVLGYLSSELVGTKVMRFIPIPGKYEGCIPYEKGEKAYS